jgi:hypothetical protein
VFKPRMLDQARVVLLRWSAPIALTVSCACPDKGNPTAGPTSGNGGTEASSNDAAPRCRSHSIIFNGQVPSYWGQPIPTCTVGEVNEVVVGYQMTCGDAVTDADAGCTNHGSGWTGCVIAVSEDLNRFDPDHAGEGVLALRFCVTGAANGALNLWYEDNVSSDKKRFLPLLSPTESLATGCQTKFWDPEDS